MRRDRKKVDPSNLSPKAKVPRDRLRLKARKLVDRKRSLWARATSEMRVMSPWICSPGLSPVVFLVRSLHILSVSPADLVAANPNAKNKSRKPGQDASHFKTDKSGKLIIPDDKDEIEQDEPASRSMEGTAFIAAQSGVDGASRDARGNLRFNKNTKRSRMEDDDMDVDFDESIKKAYMPEQKKKKKEQSKKLGEEFRAKVRLSVLQVYSQLMNSAREEISRGKVDRILSHMCPSDRLPRRARMAVSI